MTASAGPPRDPAATDPGSSPKGEPDRITIDADNAGRRLDAFVRQLLPEVALGTLMKWLRRGTIRVNGRRAATDGRLAGGDVVSVPAGLLASGPSVAGPTPAPSTLPALKILFEDADLLVVVKPAGLTAHSGSGHEHDSLMARVVAYLGAQNARPGQRPGLIQRLDRDVSGLLVVGKNATSLRSLTQAVHDDAIDKRYWALVSGVIAAKSGRINLPLRIDRDSRSDRPKTHADPGGLPASTDYEVVQRYAAATLLEVRIHTGHQHQIRAHLRAIGYPIVGDRRYGLPMSGDFRNELARPFLHAVSVAFTHPRHGDPLRFEAPLTPELQAFLRRLASNPTKPLTAPRKPTAAPQRSAPHRRPR